MYCCTWQRCKFMNYLANKRSFVSFFLKKYILHLLNPLIYKYKVTTFLWIMQVFKEVFQYYFICILMCCILSDYNLNFLPHTFIYSPIMLKICNASGIDFVFWHFSPHVAETYSFRRKPYQPFNRLTKNRYYHKKVNNNGIFYSIDALQIRKAQPIPSEY